MSVVSSERTSSWCFLDNTARRSSPSSDRASVEASDELANDIPAHCTASVIHAGTALVDDQVVTAGGRVLAVVATGDSLAEARTAAYEGVGAISFDGAQHRTDIALRAASTD